MKKVYGKLGNMRKVVDWVVYPETEGREGILFVQSDKRAVSIIVAEKRGMLSNGKGHPGFHTTNKFCGAVEVDIPDEFLNQCLESQPQSGDKIGPGVFIA